MSDLNVYASKIYSEHPLAIWALDANVGVETSFPQYSNAEHPATVSDQCKQGVPMAYGSRQSIKLANLGSGAPIIITEPRTWANVKNDPETIGEEQWDYWKDKIGPSGSFKVLDWKTKQTSTEGGGEISAPSITHHSYGMFTNAGKYNTYTAEFWMRIDARASESTKIWGTLNTFDGLWVNDNYITLVVGKENKSYAVENWYRPMLVNVTYTPTQARLVINGQEVISLTYLTDDLDFTSVEEDKENQTGIFGFSAGTGIELYEVDCIALYSYVVPDDVLKRRFVWGQGVREETSLSTAYETQITYIDYPYAEYSNNVLYPDLYNWESGYLNNLVSSRQSLRTPDFQLPEIFINGRNRDLLYLENQFRQKEDKETFFSFQPDFNWDQPSYFYFNNINKLSEPTQAVFGVFEVDAGMDEGALEPLMVFKKENGNVVSIMIENSVVSYRFNDNVLFDNPVSDVFSVGFDLNKLLHSSTADPTLKNFFANLSDIKLYVGGDGTTTFSGFIYSVGIADTSSAARNGISSKFDADGIASSSLQGVVTSYTLVPRMEYGEFWLDVAADSYWEDSIALSVLGKNLDTPTLDFFQFNIGHDGSYEINGNFYDFSKSELKTYIAFQPITDPLQKSIMDFVSTYALPKNRVVRPGAEWETTKYSVMNGTVIYPPEGVNYYDLRVVVFFDIQAENVIHSPLQIKNLSLAPQAYEENADVGTLFGARIQSTDPFAIYKESTPYLYLTKDSGIEPLEGSVQIPFNENLVAPYPINMITAWIKPDFDNMDGDTLMRVETDMDFIEIKLTGGDDKEKNLVVEASNDDIASQSKIFKNDQSAEIIGSVSVSNNQWCFIGVELPYPLNAATREGTAFLYAGAVYQNVTISKVTTRGLASVAIIRDYFVVGQQTYGHWTDLACNLTYETPPEGCWSYRELLTTESSFAYQTSPLDAFNIYTGNNGLVIGEDSTLQINETQGNVLLNVDWKTYDRTPA